MSQDSENLVIVKQSALFKPLNKREMSVIAPFLKEVKFNANEVILKQGDIGNGLYIVVDGEISVSMKLPGTASKQIDDLKACDFFGEISLIEKSLTTASIIALSDSNCMLLTQEDFYALYIVYPQIILKILQTVVKVIIKRISSNNKIIATDKHNIVSRPVSRLNIQEQGQVTESFLKTNEMDYTFFSFFKIFQHYSSDNLYHLLENMSYYKLPKNFIFFQRGSLKPSGSYFLIQGSIQVVVEDNYGYMHQVMIYGPGSIVEFDFFDKNQNNLQYITRENSIVFYLNPKTLKQFQKEYSDLYYDYYRDSIKSLVKLFKQSNNARAQIQAFN